MSKLFFDHLVVLDDVDTEIKSLAETEEERHELWHLVDEIVHHRVMGCVLNHLPEGNHNEFLEKFHEAPYDDSLMGYVDEKTEKNIENVIRDEMKDLKKEILELVKEKLEDE